MYTAVNMNSAKLYLITPHDIKQIARSTNFTLKRQRVKYFCEFDNDGFLGDSFSEPRDVMLGNSTCIR